MQQDFNKVFCSINNLRIDAAGVITGDVTGGNMVATGLADLDLDSVDFLWDFFLEDIKTVVEVLDTKEGKDVNIFRSLLKLTDFCDLFT